MENDIDKLTQELDDELAFRFSLKNWMQKEFGWPAGDASLAKDDWTLIVKLHAMIETGLNGSIIRELERPGLEDVISKLNTSGSTGKVAFARALDIIQKDAAVFIQHLSQLRNICVHNINNFNFDLVKFLATDKEAGAYTKAFNRLVNPEAPASCPQEALLIGTMGIIAALMLHEQDCHARALDDRLLRLQAEAHRKQKESKSRES